MTNGLDCVRRLGWPAAALVAGLALAGCGTEGDNQRRAELVLDATEDQGNAGEGNQEPAQAAVPFDVRGDWSDLPAPIRLGTDDEDAIFESLQECLDKSWWDGDGRRQPLVQDDAGRVIVRVDGRCNFPREETTVGVYPAPVQHGRAPIVVQNGEALGVECFVPKEEGQYIQDDRGPVSGSGVWLGVVTTAGEAGFVPETNVGYVNEHELHQQGLLREC